MCANYLPVTDGDELLAFFGVRRDFQEEAPPEAYPADLAPFIRLLDGERVAEPGRFGLLPPWRRELRFGTRTYNARSETVHTLPSYRDSWSRGLRCVIPARAVYEPRYHDDGSHERWRIGKADGTPFGIAGIYSSWLEHGQEKFSFSMLTVNCDAHPFYRDFHAPGQEKRMPVFLDPQEYDRWLSCPVAEAASWFRQSPGPFTGAAEARVPRAPRVPEADVAPKPPPVAKPPRSSRPAPPKAPPAQGELF